MARLTKRPWPTLKHPAFSRNANPTQQRLRFKGSNQIDVISVGHDQITIEFFDIDLNNPPGNELSANETLTLSTTETLRELEVKDLFFDIQVNQQELVILVENDDSSFDVKLYDEVGDFESLGLNLPDHVLDLALGNVSTLGNPDIAILARQDGGNSDALSISFSM